MPAPKLTHEQTQAVMTWHAGGFGRRAIAARLLAEHHITITDRAVGYILARTVPAPASSAAADASDDDGRVIDALLVELRRVLRGALSPADRVRVSAEVRACLADRRKAKIMSATRAADVATQADAAAVMAKIDRLTAHLRATPPVPPPTTEVH